MALDSQYISIPFNKGQDNKINQAIVDKSKLLILQNYTFNKDGTLAKRQGWINFLSNSGSNGYSTTSEIIPYGNTLLTIDNANSLNVATPDAPTQLQSVGTANFLQIRKDTIFNNTAQVIEYDCASNGNISVYVYQYAFNTSVARFIGCTVIDEKYGTVISQTVLDSTNLGRHPRVVIPAGSSNFVIAWVIGGNAIKASIYNPSTNTFSAPTSIITDISSPNVFEVCNGGAGFVIVWGNNDNAGGLSGFSVAGATFSPTLVQSGSSIGVIGTGAVAQGSVGALSLTSFNDVSPTHFGVSATTGSTSVAVAILSWNGSTLSTAASNSAITTKNSVNVAACLNSVSSKVTIFVQEAVGAQDTTSPIETFTITTALVISSVTGVINTITPHGAPSNLGGVFTLCAKPFQPSSLSGVILPIMYNSPLQTSLFFVDNAGNMYGKALYGYGGPGSTSAPNTGACGLPGSSIFINGNSVTIPILVQPQITVTGGVFSQVNLDRVLVTLDRTITSTDQKLGPLWHQTHVSGVWLTGGNFQLYDNQNLSEAGFAYFPENVATVDAGGGTSTTSGTYQVVAVYEWIDGQGNRHQSAPSPTSSITITNTHDITAYCPTLQVGFRATNQNTYIVFYRTQSNGTTFFRDVPAGDTYSIACQNVTTSATVNYRSLLTDTALGANETLYTTGGTLANNAPEACRVITSHQNRIFVAGLENPQEVRYSQLPVTGVGLQFNQTLRLLVPTQYGEVTGLASMDDKLIVFTPTTVLAILGQGPDSTGTNSSYQLQILPSDVGCIDQRSLALLPNVTVPDTGVQFGGGTGFQSKHGYYMLNRSLMTDYIGMEAENSFLVGSPGVQGNITSATVLTNLSQLRLTFTGSTGPIVIYDYLWGQWSTENSGVTTPLCGCNFLNQYTFIDGTNNYIMQESTTNSQDQGSTVIVGTIQTAWFKLSALQGYQTVRRMVILGSQFPYKSISGIGGPDSSLQVSVLFNYSAFDARNYNFTISSTKAVTTNGHPFEFRHHLQNHTCEAVSFEFVDTPTAQQGLNITGITLELGMKKGTGKNLANSQQG